MSDFIDLSDIDLNYSGLLQYRRALQKVAGRRVAVMQLRSSITNSEKMIRSNRDFSDLTIGITAFNRPRYLDRCLDYILDYFPKSCVLVADASNPENKKVHRQKIDDLKYNDREVDFHLEYFDENTPHLNPVLYLGRTAESKFFVKWDDDDFYNPEAVAEAISRMENDTSIVSMTGPSINMTVVEGDRIMVSGHATMKIADQSLFGRLAFAGTTATQCWNNLFRTDVFRQSVEKIEYLRSTELDQLWDHALSIEVALRGMCEKTDRLFMARRAGGNRVSENTMFRGRELLYKLIDPAKSADYVLFRKNVGESLTKALGEGREEEAAVALDEVCKSLFHASAGNDKLYRSVFRDFLSNHPENEAWIEIVRSDKQAMDFVSTALSVVNETD